MYKTLLQLLLASTIQALPLNSYGIQNSTIQWGQCNSTIVSDLPIECANFTVPLIYNQNSNSTLTLELLKVPALNGPSRGSILFNFGGPGLEVRNSLAADAYLYQALTGGFHDLIGFDPRGTANTLTFSCYSDSAARNLVALSTNAGAGNSSDVALGRNWAAGSIYANNCYTNEDARSKGHLINTAYVARDMMQIVDALGEDGLLRYWGFSYGTALGATVVAMFPDRVDRVILDGVLNPHQYYTQPDVESISDTDATFSGFIAECFKTTDDKCALRKNYASPIELEEALYDLIYELKYNPIPYEGVILDYNSLKGLIRPSLYAVFYWEPLARVLNALLTKDLNLLTEALEYLLAIFPGFFVSGTPDDSAFGIHCADKAWRADSLAEARPDIDAMIQKSKLMGDIFVPLLSQCAQWKMEARERYTGDFQVKTRNPVLIIGNTYDPATSIKSAYNLSSGFEGSVVLRHDGYGHCSSGQPSICTSKVIQNYFQNGELPAPGTVCEVDVPAFSNQTYSDLLPELGFNMTKAQNIAKRGNAAGFPTLFQGFR
ncbi:hypothetical protein PVAG01_07166 [Phlyctema vagabunda]|uniref:Peptidase S33 tripeptidyl aminopeptidase-like C-terminal domain-containing protein n=1 Tax=Phlyctema vagabunda TaxID=108571 RepID=A0ABR4PBM2_9HELO